MRTSCPLPELANSRIVDTLALSAHSTPKERAVPTQTREGSDRVDLPPTRAAALRKWLQVANSRLLLLEHHRQQLLALATTLADSLGQRSSAARRNAASLQPGSPGSAEGGV
jgi:hypothetical protein